MSSYIQNNIVALNANRNKTKNNKKISKNLEKLSSGYKINRAGDDASGLAISEKMRAQIIGLEQGSDNTSDGVSMCQVADGALDEVCAMLHRIKELSVTAANGTYSEKQRRYAKGSR